MKTKILTLTFGLAALALTGCETTTNTNANSAVRNANGNTAVVVNNNSNAVNMTNANRSANANVSREEYEKNRANYDKDRIAGDTAQTLNDGWILLKTRAALATTDDLRDSTINVDVTNDVITLKGTVASAAEKTKAVAAAKAIEGQKGVKDELKVQAGDSMANQMVNGNTSSSNTNTNKK